jgi:hypothetical protein
MNNYKIYKEGVGRYLLKQFINDADAAAFASSYDGGWNWQNLGAVPVLGVDEKLRADMDFCTALTDRFLKENRDAGITEEQSVALLAQFKDIMSMAQVGAVPSVYALLQNVTVGEIYTQARKDNDLADLLNYMNS